MEVGRDARPRQWEGEDSGGELAARGYGGEHDEAGFAGGVVPPYGEDSALCAMGAAQSADEASSPSHALRLGKRRGARSDSDLRRSKSTSFMDRVPARGGQQKNSGAYSSFDFSAGSETLRRRMQDIVDDELLHERTRQIEDLTSKVTALDRDRQRKRDDLNASELQYEVALSDARDQLSVVRAETETMHRDIASMEQRIQDSRRMSDVERERQEQAIREQASRAEAELRRLSELQRSQEAQLESRRVEITELRRSLDGLYDTRSRTNEQSLRASHAAQSCRDSLDESRRQLEASEQRRAVLRDRYVQVGQQFEVSICRSEQKSQTLVAELEADIARQRRKCDKYEQRLQGTEMEANAAESGLLVQQSALDDKSAELARLKRVLEEERASASRQEQHLERIPKAPRVWKEGSANAYGPMIAVATHQQLLDEQAQSFREELLDLERGYKMERDNLAVVAASPPRQGRRRRAAPGDEPMSPGSLASPVRRARARAAQEEAARRTAVRADALEAELRGVRQAIARADAAATWHEEQLLSLDCSLQEACSHLARLQKLVDAERRGEEIACAEACEARKETAARQEELAAKRARLQERGRQAAEAKRLAVIAEESARRLSSLEERHEERRQECQERQLELLTLQGEQKSRAQQADTAESEVKRLEAQRLGDFAKLKSIGTVVGWLQQLAKTHVREARSQLQQLHADASVELRQLAASCQDQGQHICVTLTGRGRRARADELVAQRASEDAARRMAGLQRQAEAAATEVGELEQELELRRSEESNSETVQAELQAKLVAARRGGDRLLSAVSVAMPCPRSFEQLKVKALGATGGLDAQVLADMQAALKDGLRVALAEARDAAAASELAEVDARSAAEARKSESAVAMQQSEHDAATARLAARSEGLAAELARRQRELRASGERRAESVETEELEVARLEASVEAADERVVEHSAAAERLARQLNGLRIEASLSLELSRSDAAEPLKAQLYDVLARVEELQTRFRRELRDLDKDQVARCEEDTQVHDERLRESRKRFADESAVLGREVQAERSAKGEAFEAATTHASELGKALAQGRAEADDASDACRRLRDECEAAAREEARSMAALQVAEGRLAHSQEARRREQEVLVSRRSELAEEQERELTKLRRKKDQEISAMQARLHESLSSLSAVAAGSDAGDSPGELGASSFAFASDAELSGFASPPRQAERRRPASSHAPSAATLAASAARTQTRQPPL